MTDSSALLPSAQAITSDLNYALKPSAVRSRSYRASILPTNKATFAPSDTCIIYVPGGRRNSYLDVGQTYMRFTVKNTDATNAFRMDGNASSVINRIDIFHGSNLLETIQGYNILVNYILDMQASQSQRAGLANIYGFDTAGDRQGVSISAGAQQTFCMPIFSGVVGVLADKCLPIGMLADDIRLEITFETSALGVVATAGTPVYSVVDFQLELCIIELSDEGEGMVRQVANPDEPIYLHGSSWRHYTSNLASGTSGGYSTLVPARFASLKQLALCPRRSSDQIATSYAIASRVNPNIEYYWWRIGSSVIPSKAVYLANTNNTGGYAEGYAELLKSWHALHTVANSSALGGANTEYNRADIAIANTPVLAGATAGSGTYANGFVIAQELESFAQRNDVLLCGMNTLSSQVFFECNIASTGPSVAYTLDFYAWYDHILVLERGLLSVKF